MVYVHLVCQERVTIITIAKSINSFYKSFSQVCSCGLLFDHHNFIDIINEVLNKWSHNIRRTFSLFCGFKLLYMIKVLGAETLTSCGKCLGIYYLF